MKIPQIESYIAYQKSTDKLPATLASYRSDLMQIFYIFLLFLFDIFYKTI